MVNLMMGNVKSDLFGRCVKCGKKVIDSAGNCSCQYENGNVNKTYIASRNYIYDKDGNLVDSI